MSVESNKTDNEAKIAPKENQNQNQNSNELKENDNNQESKPNTDNTIKPKKKSRPVLSIEHGHCSLQGIRPSMEDQVVIESTFNVANSLSTSGYHSLYGVFDGHGGGDCAKYCSSNLIEKLSKYLLVSPSVDIAFESAIKEIDILTIKHSLDGSGSTACIVLIDLHTSELWVCNVGDSRCVLVNNIYNKVEQLSIEHKPDYPIEKKRINDASGWVSFGRVCGILAVSRSLGDKDFKTEIENLIISTPDITYHKIDKNIGDKYLVLACDGLYDVFTNEQCMQWLSNNYDSTNSDLQSITNKLTHDAIYVRHSRDNVSTILIQINYIDDEEEEETNKEETDMKEDNITSNHEDNHTDEDNQLQEIEENIEEIEENELDNKNSVSSSSSLSPHNMLDDSLQSQMSNSSNETNHHHRSKFHVSSPVIDNDDEIGIQKNEKENQNDSDNHHHRTKFHVTDVEFNNELDKNINNDKGN